MKILNNKEKRLIKLLNYINSNIFYSIIELSNLLDCSKSTVLNDLTTLSTNWEDLILINTEKDNMVKMKIISNGNINKIVSDIIFNSLEIQFIKLLFFHPHQNIYFYAEQLFTSPATLYRTIKKISTDLKHYGLKIESDNKTYHLIGDNQTSLFLFFAKGLEEFYGQEIPMVSNKEELNTFRSLYNFYLPEEEYFMFLIWGTIKRNNLNNQKYKLIDFNIFKMYYDKIPLPNNLDTSILFFIKEIEKNFNVSEDISFKLKSILIFCLRKEYLLKQEYIFINRYHLFVKNIVNSGDPHFLDIERNLRILLTKLNMNIEFSLDYIIYLLITNSSIGIKLNTKKTVFIYSDLGANHAIFLKKSILSVLTKSNFEVKIVDLDFFENYIQQKDELIVSTTFLSKNINTIFVDDYLTEYNYVKIKKALRLF